MEMLLIARNNFDYKLPSCLPGVRSYFVEGTHALLQMARGAASRECREGHSDKKGVLNPVNLNEH